MRVAGAVTDAIASRGPTLAMRSPAIAIEFGDGEAAIDGDDLAVGENEIGRANHRGRRRRRSGLGLGTARLGGSGGRRESSAGTRLEEVAASYAPVIENDGNF